MKEQKRGFATMAVHGTDGHKKTEKEVHVDPLSTPIFQSRLSLSRAPSRGLLYSPENGRVTIIRVWEIQLRPFSRKPWHFLREGKQQLPPPPEWPPLSLLP